MTPLERTRFLYEDLKYNDYKLIINAKSGHWVKAEKEAMKRLQPYYDKGYLDTNKEGHIWLTEKGVKMLKAVGCEPNDPKPFLDNYGHLLDLMK